MARRNSFNSLITQVARANARMQKEKEKQAREYQRNLERAKRIAIQQKGIADKEAKQRYIASRMEETIEQNVQL